MSDLSFHCSKKLDLITPASKKGANYYKSAKLRKILKKSEFINSNFDLEEKKLSSARIFDE